MEDFGEGLELGGNSLGAFVHSPHSAVNEIFGATAVGRDSVVWDVGCGDGRSCLVALESFSARCAVGIDVDDELVKKFASKAQQKGLLEGRRCICVCRDALELAADPALFETYPPPTHVYIYILQHLLPLLVPLVRRVQREYPEVIVISAFPFPGSRATTSAADDGESDAAECASDESLLYRSCWTHTEQGGMLSFHVYSKQCLPSCNVLGTKP